MDIDDATFSMEDRLRSLGILDDGDRFTPSSVNDSTALKGISLAATTPKKKVCFSRLKEQTQRLSLALVY